MTKEEKAALRAAMDRAMAMCTASDGLKHIDLELACKGREIGEQLWNAAWEALRCRKERACVHEDGHEGACDDIPF